MRQELVFFFFSKTSSGSILVSFLCFFSPSLPFGSCLSSRFHLLSICLLFSFPSVCIPSRIVYVRIFCPLLPPPSPAPLVLFHFSPFSMFHFSRFCLVLDFLCFLTSSYLAFAQVAFSESFRFVNYLVTYVYVVTTVGSLGEQVKHYNRSTNQSMKSIQSWPVRSQATETRFFWGEDMCFCVPCGNVCRVFVICFQGGRHTLASKPESGVHQPGNAGNRRGAEVRR